MWGNCRKTRTMDQSSRLPFCYRSIYRSMNAGSFRDGQQRCACHSPYELLGGKNHPCGPHVTQTQQWSLSPHCCRSRWAWGTVVVNWASFSTDISVFSPHWRRVWLVPGTGSQQRSFSRPEVSTGASLSVHSLGQVHGDRVQVLAVPYGNMNPSFTPDQQGTK